MRLRLFALAGVLFFAAGAVARAEAPIVWLSPVSETGKDSDILNSGTFFAAATAGPTTTVNGVTFATESGFSGGVVSFGANSDITYSGIQVASASYGSAPAPAYDAAYAALVDHGAYASRGGTVAINLNNLTAGETYRVQVIEAFWNYNWQTDYTAGGNSVALNLAGASPAAGVPAASAPEYVIGAFVANGSTETITLSAASSYMVPDAISVAAVPEPSTWAMLLGGFAALGFVGYRRNKAASVAG